MKSLQTLKILLPGLIILLSGSHALGQEKLNIAAGAGIPELLNLGLRFQLGQSQLGLYGGMWPSGGDKVYSLGADYYYHFGGSSNFSTRRPWYSKVGITYFHDGNQYEKHKYLILVPRIGRDLNLSPKIGIALEGGLLLLLSHSEEKLRTRESCWLCGGSIYPDIGPSLGLSIFYRL